MGLCIKGAMGWVRNREGKAGPRGYGGQRQHTDPLHFLNGVRAQSLPKF